MNPPVAKRGASVLDWARELVAWAISFRKFSGGGVRLTVTPEGTWITAVSAHTWDHPFRVTVSGLLAEIGAGTVDGEIPFLEEGELRLDGTGPEYEITDEEPPRLNLEALGMDEGRSVIELRVAVDGATGQVEELRVFHEELPRAKALPETTGAQALAILNWKGGQVVRVDQVVHHHLHYYFLAGDTEEDEPEHLFSAV